MTSVSVGRQLMVNNVTGVRRVPGWRMPRRTNETHHLHNSVLDKAEEGEEWLCNYCTEYLRNPSTYNPCVCVCSDNMTHRGQWLHIGTSNHLFILKKTFGSTATFHFNSVLLATHLKTFQVVTHVFTGDWCCILEERGSFLCFIESSSNHRLLCNSVGQQHLQSALTKTVKVR